MAQFAQVGAGATYSMGGQAGSHPDQSRTFDPLSSHQYSRAPEAEPYSANPSVDPGYAGQEFIGHDAEPEFQSEPEEPRFEHAASTPPVETRITRVEPVFAPKVVPSALDHADAQLEGHSSATEYATTEQASAGYYETEGAQDVYPPAAGRSDMNKMAAIFGAVASLALIVGIGSWGYKLIMRDVSGVPVVRSVEGPMRVQPDNPGGTLADHQGLAVNAVAAHGTAADPADTLRLAPSAVGLTEDDQPLPTLLANVPEPAEIAPAPAESVSAVTAVTEATSEEQGTTQYAAPEPSALEQRSNDIDALVAALTEGVPPLSNVTPTSASAAIVQPEPVLIEPAVATVAARVPAGRVINAPRPQLRPARFTPAPVVSAAAPSVVEVDVASLAVGTRLAQLGAYESADVARSEWTRISAKFGDFFEGKQRVVQRAESGGRVFYRLRVVGFSDLSDSRRFCSALVAGNADCIPVLVR